MTSTSALYNLCEDLAAMTVTYTDVSGNTKTPTAYGINEIPNSLQTAKLPCRVILPFGESTIITQKGAGVIATWQLSDVFLLDTLAQGTGPKDFARPLLTYAENYASAINIMWRFPKARAGTTEELELTQITISQGVQEYPPQSGVFFFGVRATLTISEYFI